MAISRHPFCSLNSQGLHGALQYRMYLFFVYGGRLFSPAFSHLLFAMAKVVSVCLVCLGAFAGSFVPLQRAYLGLQVVQICFRLARMEPMHSS